jgi:hypothetical protein
MEKLNDKSRNGCQNRESAIDDDFADISKIVEVGATLTGKIVRNENEKR